MERGREIGEREFELSFLMVDSRSVQFTLSFKDYLSFPQCCHCSHLYTAVTSSMHSTSLMAES